MMLWAMLAVSTAGLVSPLVGNSAILSFEIRDSEKTRTADVYRSEFSPVRQVIEYKITDNTCTEYHEVECLVYQTYRPGIVAIAEGESSPPEAGEPRSHGDSAFLTVNYASSPEGVDAAKVRHYTKGSNTIATFGEEATVLIGRSDFSPTTLTCRDWRWLPGGTIEKPPSTVDVLTWSVEVNETNFATGENQSHLSAGTRSFQFTAHQSGNRTVLQASGFEVTRTGKRATHDISNLAKVDAIGSLYMRRADGKACQVSGGFIKATRETKERLLPRSKDLRLAKRGRPGLRPSEGSEFSILLEFTEQGVLREYWATDGREVRRLAPVSERAHEAGALLKKIRNEMLPYGSVLEVK